MKDYHGAGAASEDPNLMSKSPSMRSTGSSHSGGSGKQSLRDPPMTLPGRVGTANAPGNVVSCGGSDIGNLDRAMYKTTCYTTNERESSLSPEEKGESSREKAAENESKTSAMLGSLFFTLEYDSEKSALVVAVTRAKDLPIKDLNVGSSDPYIKLQLLPDKRQKVSFHLYKALRSYSLLTPYICLKKQKGRKGSQVIHIDFFIDHVKTFFWIHSLSNI